ncbi:MAG: hypothetical protein JW850_08345 [Thermoflexales bacterium]|nr:hypothetical protein [Thermoflexales bacterium]
MVGCAALFAVVTTCSCCALSSGLVAWSWRQYTAYPTDPEALAQVVQHQVVQMRGLEFIHPVTVRTLTPDELRERMQRELEQEWPPEEARKYALTLAAFDLMHPDTDLYQLYLDLLSEQVVGLYDTDTKELYVVADGKIGVLGRMILAHELTHALQDQHYDLNALGYGEQVRGELDSEHMSGIVGLVEGDASLLQSMYMRTFSALDWARLGWEYAQLDMDTLESAPEALTAGLTFPYQEGQRFVVSLYESGGWAAVDAAFARPPQSTEQILHPERYRAGDRPRLVALPPLTDTLGAGWQFVDEDIMGEFYTRLHLSPQTGSLAAAEAAEGWGGDRYAVYSHESQAALLLAWRTVWDNETEADQFVEEYKRYLDDVAGHEANLAQADRACWQLPDQYRCLVWSADRVTVVRGPDAYTVERVMQVLR